MEENSTNITQMHFTMSLAYLVAKYIEITLLTYDRKFNEGKINKYELLAINNIIHKYQNINEEQATEQLNTYFIGVMKQESEISLTPGLMYDFCEWTFRNYKNTPEYIADLKRYKTEYDLEELESYAYDKRTNEIINCEFGGHSEAISKLCNAYLTEKYGLEKYDKIPEKYFEELDEYIEKNIILKGTFYNDDSLRYNKYTNVNPYGEM